MPMYSWNLTTTFASRIIKGKVAVVLAPDQYKIKYWIIIDRLLISKQSGESRILLDDKENIYLVNVWQTLECFENNVKSTGKTYS